ncbi:hypothetical protein ALP05_102269 [Pseudomonas caricapapayae]|uniref:Uncharacterized protein n=1 Tax=Pseudomonas caricapapayae TaxID=46678 RepID=A0A3M6EYC8_9PSED|nr:hypothetical protein ALP05_102269 [Pseudomonas caricapapayae]
MVFAVQVGALEPFTTQTWLSHESDRPVLVRPTIPFAAQAVPAVATPLSCRYSPTVARRSEVTVPARMSPVV